MEGGEEGRVRERERERFHLMTDTSTTTELVFPEGNRGERGGGGWRNGITATRMSLTRSLTTNFSFVHSTALRTQMIRYLGPAKSLIKARAEENKKDMAQSGKK
jgi:hypothetical protein